jgi:peptide-methionine (S)-S-oxide reductase
MNRNRWLLVVMLSWLVSCRASSAGEGTRMAPPVAKGQAVAVFASGCFWCSESDFEKVEGVISVVSGYSGGAEQNPTYEQVSSGSTGHTESVRVIYDPKKVTYEQLLRHYWRHVDPLSGDGQFCDRGRQYRPAIFVSTQEERQSAERTRREVEQKLKQKVAVEILDAATFWEAEAYHQDFAKRNPARYQSYRLGCGRDRRVAEIVRLLDAP